MRGCRQRKEGAVSIAFVDLCLERADAILTELVLNVAQRPGFQAADVRVKRTAYGMRLLKAFSCWRISFTALAASLASSWEALRGDDNKIGPADRIGNHHGGSAFEIDDNERGLSGSIFNFVDYGFFGDVGDHR